MPPVVNRGAAALGGHHHGEGRSWADQMDNDLPAPQEIITGNTKVVIEYRKSGENNKPVKITRTYKLEKRNLSLTVAARKQWRKFGAASHDKAGPDPATTNVGDDIYMQFLSSKDEERGSEQDNLEKLKANSASAVKCRYCSLEHFSIKCPYKDKLQQLTDKDEDVGPSDAPRGGLASSAGGKYVPPSQRAGGNLKGDSMPRSRDELNTVRVTNLPEDVQDQDIKELFQEAGRVSRIYLAKDKYTGQSKGFAFVSFETREQALTAIAMVNGFGYANLILNVELAKPSEK